MRGSGWIAAAAAWLLGLACVAWPLVALAFDGRDVASTTESVTPPAAVFFTTITWSVVIAAGAALVGWPAGIALGRAAGRRGFLPFAVACFAPICLPAYLVFYAWWQAWPPDSSLYAWAVDNELIPLLRRATLGVSLVCWAWPLVAWCVAGAVSTEPRERREMLDLEGAAWTTRLAVTLRRDGRGLGLGAFIVFIAVFNNTTCFDLAEIFTIGNELRALEARGAGPAALLVAATPSLTLTAVAVLAVWTLLATRPVLTRSGTPGPASTGTLAVTIVIWAVTVLTPLGIFVTRLGGVGEIGRFVQLYGGGLADTAAVAAVTGGAAAVLALGMAGQFRDRRRWVRRLGHVQAIGWLVMAAVPATIVTAALEAGYNVEPPASAIAGGASQSHITMAELIYAKPVILVLGHLARLGFVAVLLGQWTARQRPAAVADAASLDGADTLRGQLAADGPRAIAAMVAVLAITFVLSVSEIPVTAQLRPPGHEAIATTILNDMHYQRPRTVMVAALVFCVGGLGAAVLAVGVWGVGRRGDGAAGRRMGLWIVGLVSVVGLGGCGDRGSGPGPLDPLLVFGSTGDALGQFHYPRGIAVDADREVVYIVDKTARVQRFGFDGKPQVQWHMPAMELGKPTGVNVADDGTVWLADAHYFRIIAYDADGRELLRFGSYGEETGQFIYPTDVAFGPDGRLYVSEYGGNDRVQVFSPEGEFLFSFGTFGEGPGEFNRPQSMVFNPDQSELFIADAINHRIVVTDVDGRTLRTFGTPGRAPGELLYPYDLALLEDGSLVVCEFGNNRIQRFDRAGVTMTTRGVVGAGAGDFQYPWGVDVAGGRVFVLDSGNNRVQVIRRPS